MDDNSLLASWGAEPSQVVDSATFIVDEEGQPQIVPGSQLSSEQREEATQPHPNHQIASRSSSAQSIDQRTERVIPAEIREDIPSFGDISVPTAAKRTDNEKDCLNEPGASQITPDGTEEKNTGKPIASVSIVEWWQNGTEVIDS
jgi:hypothetical protein